MSELIIAPSLLAADQLQLGNEISAITNAGADWLHVDVMDGHYVPNIAYGPDFVKAVKKSTNLTVDVHLMISPVLPYISAFAEAGADIITFHPEADPHPHRVVSMIKEHGIKAGIALNPATPVCSLDALWPVIDLILIMSVNPGFSGQKFIAESLTKLQAIRHHIDTNNLDITVAVDGGINQSNSQMLRDNGANAIIVGSGLFTHAMSDYKRIIQSLKGN